MRKLVMFVLVVLLFMLIVPAAVAAPRSATVTVNVLRQSTGQPFPPDDEVMVYLYKSDYVTGKHYDQVLYADVNGTTVFTRVPLQEMRVLIYYKDNYVTPEGYHLFTMLGGDAFPVTITGDATINWVTTF